MEGEIGILACRFDSAAGEGLNKIGRRAKSETVMRHTRLEVDTEVIDSKVSRQDKQEHSWKQRNTVGLNCIYFNSRGLTDKADKLRL